MLLPVLAHESCLTIMKRQSQPEASSGVSEDPNEIAAAAWVDQLPLRPEQPWDVS